MNYPDAFIDVVRREGFAVVDDPFRMRCLLADRIGSSPNGDRLLNAYFALSKLRPVYATIAHKKLSDAKNALKPLFALLAKSFSVEESIRSVEPLFALLFPQEYRPISAPKAAKIAKRSGALMAHPILPEVTPQPKAKRREIPINRVHAKIKCAKLLVEAYQGKTVELIARDHVGLNPRLTKSRRNGRCSYELEDAIGNYVLRLPQTGICALELEFHGRNLSVQCRRAKTKFLNLSLNLDDCFGWIDADTFLLTCRIRRGSLGILGAIENVVIDGGDAAVSGVITERNPRQYRISCNKGDIDLRFPNGQFKPKPQGVFSQKKSLMGDFLLSGRKVRFDLSTVKGKVKVK